MNSNRHINNEVNDLRIQKSKFNLLTNFYTFQSHSQRVHHDKMMLKQLECEPSFYMISSFVIISGFIFT